MRWGLCENEREGKEGVTLFKPRARAVSAIIVDQVMNNNRGFDVGKGQALGGIIRARRQGGAFDGPSVRTKLDCFFFFFFFFFGQKVVV